MAVVYQGVSTWNILVRQLVSGGVGSKARTTGSRYPLYSSQIHNLQTEDNMIYFILCFSFAKARTNTVVLKVWSRNSMEHPTHFQGSKRSKSYVGKRSI